MIFFFFIASKWNISVCVVWSNFLRTAYRFERDQTASRPNEATWQEARFHLILAIWFFKQRTAFIFNLCETVLDAVFFF